MKNIKHVISHINQVPFEIKEVQAKSILVKSNVEGIDYVINPYTGCLFGCIYCYASFMGRFIHGKSIDDWGNYVYIKINAPDLLEKQINRLKNEGRGLEILFSSVTDPYQGVEAKYKLTRRCLKILVKSKFQGTVSILTKSNLILRDIDLLKQLKNCYTGITITSTEDIVSRYFERYAPPSSIRLEVLQKLNTEKLHTYAFVGPLLPHFASHRDQLDKLFLEIKEAGTRNIFVEHLNLSPYIKNRFIKEMKGERNKVLHDFYESQSKVYRKKINKVIHKLIQRYQLNLLEDIIYHRKVN